MTLSPPRRLTLSVAATGAIAVALVGCTAATPDPTPTTSPSTSAPAVSPALEALIEEARAEGALDLVWGEGVLGGTAAAPEYAAGFKAYYGLPDLDVTFTAGPPFTQMAATLTQEVAAGQPATSDIYLGYAPQFVTLLGATPSAFEPTDWSWAENIPAEAIGGDGASVEVATGIPVITYNSAAVSEPPTSMADLLDADWQGRIASTPYASNFHYFAAMIGHDEALDYLESFSGQLAGLIPCTQQERLLTGEFDLFAFDCDQTSAVRNERAGGALRYVIPSDAAMLSFISLGVPVNSAHPAAAKLWINYMLSRDAQEIMWQHYGGDYTGIDGSHTAEAVAALEADGVEFSSWGLDTLLTSDTWPSQEYIAQLVAILSSAG